MTLLCKIGLAGSILFVAGCQGGQSPRRVTLLEVEVEAHQRSWNGAILWVDGWINGCGGYDCSMYASEKDAKFDWQHVRSGDKMPVILGIALNGSGSGWMGMDAQLNRLGLRHILLKARVDGQCAGHICTDRSPDLHPITFKVLTNTQHGGN